MNKTYLKDIDLSTFWDDADYAKEAYLNPPPTDELIASIEKELGYKLPASYIALMQHSNGGIPVNTCFPTTEGTSWAPDHIAISGIMGIGRDKSYSLCGGSGSAFMIDEWGYPNIGVVICDCPSGGHDVVMLDYRRCGKGGEPEVVIVDQEQDYAITFLAKDFETFISGLVHDDVYDTSEEDKAIDLKKVSHGKFSTLLTELCAEMTEVNSLEEKIRAICTQIVNDKGHFSFHADELSTLMYDIQFWLYTNTHTEITKEKYLEDYPKMIVFGAEFSTGGYAPSFLIDWLDERIKKGSIIIEEENQISFTEKAVSALIEKVALNSPML